MVEEMAELLNMEWGPGLYVHATSGLRDEKYGFNMIAALLDGP